jgi:YHS domain-containing protein
VLRLLLLFGLFWVIAQVFWRFIDGVVRGATMPPPGGARPKGAASPVKMQPCPVCGTYVVPGKAISATSSAGQVHFCSDKCRTEYSAR